METYRRGDAAGMASLYTEDGQLLSPNSDFARGRHAIQQFWQAVIDAGIKRVELHTGEVEQHGERVIEVSTTTLRGEGDQVLDGYARRILSAGYLTNRSSEHVLLRTRFARSPSSQEVCRGNRY